MMDSCFRKELAVMKDKIKNLKMGVGNIVCSEASIFCSATATHLGGRMIFSFHERWNSKVGSQIILRRAFRVSQTMQLRNV